MNKDEIALELVLAMIEKGSYRTIGCDTNEDYGKAIAELYNSVKKSLED